MNEQHFNKLRTYFITAAVLFALGQLLWEHLQGGVVTHHFLARADYPGVSNWWVIIVLPLLVWFASARVKKRIFIQSDDATGTAEFPKCILIGFFGVFALALVQSVGYEFGYENISMYSILSLLIIGLFLPIYRAECILAHVLGTTFTFGPIIPLTIVAIIALISAFSNLCVKPLVARIWRQIKGSGARKTS